jgi:hypothetical protein
MIQLSEKILRQLPADENEATKLVNEILEQALLGERELSLPVKNVSLAEKLKRSKDDREAENSTGAVHAGI